MNSKRVWILLIIVFFVAGAAGSFFLSKKILPVDKPAPAVVPGVPSDVSGDLMSLKLYFPVQGSLQMEERRVPSRSKQLALAETIIEEYFRGPSRDKSVLIPGGVRVLGLYQDAGRILYIDLSDDVRRNFQGDARAEYLLLKGLGESLFSNLQDFQDFKVLVEGRELESLGGHVYLKFPLKMIVSAETRKLGDAARE